MVGFLDDLNEGTNDLNERIKIVIKIKIIATWKLFGGFSVESENLLSGWLKNLNLSSNFHQQPMVNGIGDLNHDLCFLIIIKHPSFFILNHLR